MYSYMMCLNTEYGKFGLCVKQVDILFSHYTHYIIDPKLSPAYCRSGLENIPEPRTLEIEAAGKSPSEEMLLTRHRKARYARLNDHIDVH